MSHTSIYFNMENDAFQEEARNHEAARILRKIADNIESGIQDEETIVRDVNGNTVGTVEFYIGES